MIGFPPCFLIELGGFLLIEPPIFSPRFLIKFRRFFHQLNIHSFLLSLQLGLGGFLHQNHDLKRLYAHQSSHLRGKTIVMSWSHMISHVIDLIWSTQFQIITDLVSKDWLSHQLLDYLIFQINRLTFGSTFWINLLNQPMQSTFSLNWQRH